MLELTEIDAALIVGYIPTPEELNSGDFDYPSAPQGAAPIGDNGFVMSNTDEYEAVRVDPSGAYKTSFLDDSDELSAGSLASGLFNFAKLDKDRTIALAADRDIWGTITSVAGGTLHATATGQDGWDGHRGRFFRLQNPFDTIDGSPWDPDGSGYQSNNTWFDASNNVWTTGDGTKGHAVFTINRNRPGYGGVNSQDYEVYLLSFTINDTEIADQSSTPLLLPPANTPWTGGNPETWLSGEAYPINDNAFFVHDRIHPFEATPEGYRADVSHLRAYDYSGNLLAISDEPIYTQTFHIDPATQGWLGTTGFGHFEAGGDGTIVSLAEQHEYFAGQTPDGYSSFNAVTQFKVRRNTFNGSSWDMGTETIVFDSGHVNRTSWVVNFQQYQPNRFVLDSMRVDSPFNQHEYEHVNRVLTILDENFNVVDELVLDPPTTKYQQNGQNSRPPNWYYDTDDWWSCFAPEAYGLVGWIEYGDTDENYNDIPKLMTVKHSPLIFPMLSAELGITGRMFEAAT